MPSRRKKKQALRDSAITKNFFNQANPGVCSCCAGPCHKKATSLTDLTEPDPSKCPMEYAATETNCRTGAETLRGEMISLWKDKYESLTMEQREEVLTAVSSETITILDPHSLLKELKLAQEQMMDVPATADEPSSMKTFALDNLDEVAEEYDELCQKYKDEEERKMANLAGLVSNLASSASDTTQSTEDRLAAELDIHNVNIHSKIIVPLTSCLRQVQLFNVEKKFGFVEESYQALSNDDRKKRGEDVPAEVPLSSRQKLNNPFKPTGSTPKPRRRMGKKKIGSLEALAELQNNYKHAIKEIQDSGKTIGDIDESEELQSLTSILTYADVPVPEDIPGHVRQHFSDAEFAFEEVMEIRENLMDQLRKISSALKAWRNAGPEVWYVQFETVAPIQPECLRTTYFSYKRSSCRSLMPP